MKKILHKLIFIQLLFILTGNQLFSQTAIWIPKAAFGGATGTVRNFAVGFSIGTKGYIGTGFDQGIGYRNDFFEYDPATNVWTQKANFAGGQRILAVGFSIGTKGYIGTGMDFIGRLKDFWEYDPVTNAWLQKANFGGAARARAVGFKIGGKGYIGTGYEDNSSTYFSDFWEYTPSTNSWLQKAAFGGGIRREAVGFSIGNKGYLGTGYDGIDYKADFWQYNPATNTWAKKTNIGTAQLMAIGFSIGSKGYIGIGFDNLSGPIKEFWEYDTITNSWTRATDFGGTARSQAVGFSIGLKGYVGTGLDINNVKTRDFWEYQPVYIYTGNIALSRICVSKTVSIPISVPYTISTSFSPGNVFTAQLSDSSGSFLSPINIGSRTDTLGGTISANLPANLSPGFKYRIRVISSNPSFVGSDNKKNLSINPKPTPSIVIDDTLQCLNENKFNYNNTSTVSFGSIAQTLWNFGDGFSAITKIATHSYLIDGILSVKLKTITDSGCADSTSKLVRILPSPNASYTASDTLMCFMGNSFIFTNTSTIKAGNTLTYKWYKGNGDSATTKNLTFSYPQPGKFTLKLVAYSNFGCNDTAFRVIQVDSIPIIGFTINDSTQCSGSNKFIFTNTTKGSSIYLWSLGDGKTSTDTNVTHIYATNNTFNVKLKAYSNPKCFDSIIKEVYVYPAPIASYSITSKDTQCLSGNLFNFYNNSTNGPFTSLWDFGDGNTNTSLHTSHSYTTSQTFIVKLIITTSKGCVDSVSHRAMVINTASLKKTSNNGPICEGQKLELYTDTIPSATYTWIGPNGFNKTITSPTYTIPKANILQSGTYEVSASLFGCVSLPTSTNVIIKALPGPPSVLDNMDVCEGEILNLSATSLPNATFSWNGPNGFNSTLDNPTVNIKDLAEAGIYTVKATVDGCEGPPDSIKVKVNLNPDFYLGKDGSVCKGDEIILDPGLFISYRWQDNSTKRNYSIMEPGTYWVEVINEFNCKGSDTIVFTDLCPPSFFVPTVFTPNGDTWNDLFMPQGNNIYNYNLKIFNRWGLLIFETNDISVGWDGRFTGVDCPVDMYYWYASWYSNWDNEEKKNAKYGAVYLTR